MYWEPSQWRGWFAGVEGLRLSGTWGFEQLLGSCGKWLGVVFGGLLKRLAWQEWQSRD